MKTLTITLHDSDDLTTRLAQQDYSLRWNIPEENVTWTIYIEAMVRFINGLGFSLSEEDIMFQNHILGPRTLGKMISFELNNSEPLIKNGVSDW